MSKKYHAFKFYKNPRFTLKKKTTQIYPVPIESFDQNRFSSAANK